MESLKDMAVNKFRKPSISSGGKVCYELFYFIDGECGEMGVK